MILPFVKMSIQIIQDGNTFYLSAQRSFVTNSIGSIYLKLLVTETSLSTKIKGKYVL